MNLIKKILSAVLTLVLGVGSGFLLWLVAMDGTEKLKERNADLPAEPQNIYEGFYYENLDFAEKIAYEQIMDEIEEMPKKIQIPALDDEGLSNVFEALLYDNPAFFFLSENCKTETNSFGNCYFIPEYAMNLYEYDEQKTELEKVRDYVKEKTANLSDSYEKELFIHDYIVDKCEYVEKTGGTYSSAYGCLVKGTASCEGYAKAVKYLLDEEGIENYLAVGTTEGEIASSRTGHAWNIVKLGDSYYHLDATWDDPEGGIEEITSYAYFNLTDKEISETHQVEERFLGKCTDNKENYYVKNSIYFTEYTGDTRSAITSELAKQARLGSSSMSFKMADEQSLKDAEDALFEMNGVYSILLSAEMMTEESIKLDEVLYSVDDRHRIITLWDFMA